MKTITILQNWESEETSSEFENQIVEIEYALIDSRNVGAYYVAMQGNRVTGFAVEYVSGNRTFIGPGDVISFDNGEFSVVSHSVTTESGVA